MFFRNPLKEKLKQWGKKKQIMPASALAMKEKALASVKPATRPVPKKFRWPYFFAASIGSMAVLILFIGNLLLNQKAASGPGMLAKAPAASDMATGYRTDVCTGNECAMLGSAESTALSSLDGDRFTQHKEESGAQRALNVAPANQDYSSIADTREFLKYDYNAAIKTGKVAQVSSRVQTIVRGYGGRVDAVSIQEKYGYIYFAVPKTSLEAFKNEVKGLVNVRFYTESVRAQNLLNQKVAIEESAHSTKELLAALESELVTLTQQHNAKIADLQKRLNITVGSINKLRSEVTTSTERQGQIKRDISRLSGVQQQLQRQIVDENQIYNTEKADLEYKIKETKFQIIDISEQDKDLLQDVETVQGSVSVEWVSVFEVIKLYVPYYWAWILLVCTLALLFNYFSKSRKIDIK